MDMSEWVQFEANLKARHDACSDAAATPSSILLAVLNAVADVNRSALPPPAEQASGDGMLPDALVPHAKEWYRLCERRFAVDKMTISGELAEAIVDAIAALSQRPGVDEAMVERMLAQYRVLEPTDSIEFNEQSREFMRQLAKAALAPQQPEEGESP